MQVNYKSFKGNLPGRCPAGKHGSARILTTSDGQRYRDCTLCEKGKYSQGNQLHCLPCKIGFYQVRLSEVRGQVRYGVARCGAVVVNSMNTIPYCHTTIL
jgi:hypothetical protein